MQILLNGGASMKTVVTLAMNPSIDKSSSVE